MTRISLENGDSFDAYVAYPDTEDAAPVVVVIQEIFGINEGIRGKCEWLAGQGFIAVAPDLFWRLEPNVELSDKTKEEWDKAFDLMNRFDLEAGIRDLQATVDTFREVDGASGKVGTMGYCLGGKIAYLMATRSDVDASVGYYGVGLDDLLAEANNIERPLMLHIAGEDKFSSKAAQKKIMAGLKDRDLITLHVYEGQDHAFTRVGGDHYNEEAAALADGRTIDFFNRFLR